MRQTKDFTGTAKVADSNWVLAGNGYSLEYCPRLAEDFDETEDAKEGYSTGTTRLLDRIEEQWFP